MHSYKACGDGVVDGVIPGAANTAYSEACDDGNNVNGDGCSSTCTLETLPRTYTYWTKDSIVREVLQTSSHTVSDCQAPYLPAEIGSAYNARPSSGYVCYIGKYCYDCTTPKFPGYPVSLNTFLEGVTPYSDLPVRSRGRMRAISYGNESFAFSYVSTNVEVFITDGPTRTAVSHASIGATRQSWGRYLMLSSGTTGFNLYKLEKPATVYQLTQQTLTITKVVPPQLGSEFYIWWPGLNFTLSRSYNQRNFEIYSFDGTTITDGPYLPEFVVLGKILFDPVFNGGKMYLPIYTESLESTPTKTYKVVAYAPNLPWEIQISSTTTLAKQPLSLASFNGAVIATVSDTTTPFINIATNAAPTITKTGATPTCDFNWMFIQSRPDPDNPDNNPQAYAYCKYYELYIANYTSGALILDTANPISLPDDTQTSRNKNGRYNLAYPFDVNGRYLINFAIHTCSSFVVYRWDEWYDMSVSVYDLVSKTTRCVDITNSETTFE